MAIKSAPTPAGVRSRKVTLKVLADHLGLSPATVSLVMNRSSGADAIPQKTKDLVFEAARKFNYRPNFVARSLRTRRSFTVGVLVPEMSSGYAALVMSGIEDYLLQTGFFYFTVSHRHRPDLIDEYTRMLLERSVEGLIAIDTPWRQQDFPVPVVVVSGHSRLGSATNIVVDHSRAGDLALRHLKELGHRQIAVIKGPEFSSDTYVRWRAIRAAAARLGMSIPGMLITRLESDSASPTHGYQVTRKLLARSKGFTALFAFHDLAAIGAIRAILEKGLRVPEDVSVVGFDDIQSAAFQNPALTTIRQPLHKMGVIAAETLLHRISRPGWDGYPRRITVKPELVVRESTGPAPGTTRRT